MRLRLMTGAEIALGPGKANLLEAIAATGSISAAGRRIGMSYKRAWSLVQTMNHCFDQPLVNKSAGGRAGGGASLTRQGKLVLAQFRAMEATAARAIRRQAATLGRMLRK